MSTTVFSRNEVILPDKRNEMITQLRNEINLVKDDIRNKKYTDAVLASMQSNADKLQSLLNKFLNKSGVITPTETNTVLDVMASLKKQRLQKEYNTDLKRTVVYLVAAGIIALGSFYLYKKFAK